MSHEAWITRPQPHRRARCRLFCLPYAGGGSSLFRSWPAHLPPTIEICAVELPGRGGRLQEPPFTQLAHLLEAMVPALLPYLDKPFALFGHSMGALISFELARHLRRAYDLRPICLFVSGCRAPQMTAAHPPLHVLPEAKFMAELRRLDGTPEPVLQHGELMQLLLPLLRADFTLYETYTYDDEAPFECPISAFGGAQDPLVSRHSLAAWRDQTQGAFKLRILPGDHFFLNSACACLLQAITADLTPYLTANAPGGAQ